VKRKLVLENQVERGAGRLDASEQHHLLDAVDGHGGDHAAVAMHLKPLALPSQLGALFDDVEHGHGLPRQGTLGPAADHLR